MASLTESSKKESNGDSEITDKKKDPCAASRETVVAATIGTCYILNSPDVEDAPARINHPVPVPSIYQDERGEIHNFRISGFRVNLLHTKAGVMRSGDLHKDIQHDFVFYGKVRVWTLQKSTGETVKTVYGPCQYIAIPPYTPHIFEFVEDSLVAEWWDGPFYAWFYNPYRQLVQQSFRVTQPGKFAHYVVQENLKTRHTSTTRELLETTTPIAIWVALCLGAALGFVAGAVSARHQRKA